MKEILIYINKFVTNFFIYIEGLFHNSQGVNANFAEVGHSTVTNPFIQNVCIYFTSLPGIIVQVMFILSVGFINWRNFKVKIAKINAQLNEKIAILEKIKNKSEFVLKFTEIDKEFLNSSILSNSWKEFKNTLLMPGSHPIETDCIVNTQYPYSFFTEITIVKPFINLNYFNSIPNKLTGLGIMGTFLGLVAGIYLAASGITSNNMDEAKIALSHLLDGASLGFLTSIAGLGSSLVFSWREKAKIYKLAKQINKINDLLEAHTQFVNTELLSCLILVENKKQSHIFSDLSLQISKNIGIELEGKVSNPLIETLNKIQVSLEVLNDNQVKASDETIKQLIEEFGQKISGAAGREMRAFASVLQRMSAELRTQIATISSSQENLQQNIKITLDDLVNSFSDGSRKLKDEMNLGISNIVNGVSIATKDMSLMLKDTTGSSFESMTKAAMEFESAIVKLKDSSTDIAAITQNNSALSQEIRMMLNSIQEVHDKISDVITPISNVSKNLSVTSSGLVKGIEEFETITENNAETLKIIQQVQLELKNNWNNYLTRFESVDESLGSAMEGLNNGYAGFVKSTNSYLIGLDKNSSQIVDKLSGAVRELSTVIEDWPAGV